MRRRGFRTALLSTLALLGLAAVVWGAWRVLRNPVDDVPLDRRVPAAGGTIRPERIPRPPAPAGGYIGSTACSECHAHIWERYQSHPMSRSLARVEDAAALEGYTQDASFLLPPAPRARTQLRYGVRREATGVSHYEQALDLEGRLIYEQRVPIDYSVGSGQRGRSYFTNRDGLLFMSPITWYAQAGRWNLSPGYQIKNLRFERRVLDACVVCHAGNLAPIPGRPDCFEPEPFIEPSIGCERCHGPGKDHVAWHEGGARARGADPITNPARLKPHLRDSVCFQCHLGGEERFTRYRRTEFDFRPGDDVTDIWTIFLRGTGVGDDQTTTAVSQSEQMLSSACYQKSEGRLSCTSCHDPHWSPEPSESSEFYRDRCLNCHDSGDPHCSMPAEERRTVAPDDSCIECHMPKLATNDVPHTSQTDHRVLRSYERQDEPADTAGRPLLTVFGVERGTTPPAEIERAQGLLMVQQSLHNGNKIMAQDAIPRLKPWYNAAPDDLRVAEALGISFWLNDEKETARKLWEEALERDPARESLLQRLVGLYHDSGRLEQALAYSERLVQVNPWMYEHFGRMAHILGQLGRLDEGITAAEKALELNPSAAGIHGWLAEVHALRGETELSRHHREQFELLSLPK